MAYPKPGLFGYNSDGTTDPNGTIGDMASAVARRGAYRADAAGGVGSRYNPDAGYTAPAANPSANILRNGLKPVGALALLDNAPNDAARGGLTPDATKRRGMYVMSDPNSVPAVGGTAASPAAAKPNQNAGFKNIGPEQVRQASGIRSNGGVIRGQGIGGDEDYRRVLLEMQYGVGKGSPSTRRALMENYVAGQNRDAESSMLDRRLQAESFDKAQGLNMDADADMRGRRDKMNMFNADQRNTMYRWGAEQADKRRAATAGPSMKERAEAVKLLAEANKIRTGTAIESGKYDDSSDATRRAQWLKDNPGATNTDFDMFAAQEQAGMGFDPTQTDAGRRGDAMLRRSTADTIGQGDNFVVEALTGQDVGLFNNKGVNGTIDWNNVNVRRNEGALPSVMRFMSNIPFMPDYDERAGYRVEYGSPDENGDRASKVIGKAQAQQLQSYTDGIRRAQQRRSQDR